MNREIKFRAWDGKRFTYWGLGKNKFIGPAATGNGGPLNMVHQQCTGIKDKWGHEIYEGDILENKYKGIRDVFWDEDDACFSVEGTYLNRMARDGAIIGNIHESEHLLYDTDTKPRIEKESK